MGIAYAYQQCADTGNGKRQTADPYAMPGRVYRNETVSARSHCFFHQVEGLYIDENVSFADLKQTLYFFVKEMYGKDVKVRFRPSYFPFTEPSAEMDVTCFICGGKVVIFVKKQAG